MTQTASAFCLSPIKAFSINHKTLTCSYRILHTLYELFGSVYHFEIYTATFLNYNDKENSTPT